MGGPGSKYKLLRNGHNSATAGFTLIELMVVVVIVAILLTLALPSFSVLSLRTKLKSYANEMVASVYLARGEAIKRNANMTLCIAKSNVDECESSGDWDQGWLVMDPNETVVKRYQKLSSGIVLFETSSTPIITFNPSGLANAVTEFTICQEAPNQGLEEKVVTISRTGRTKIETTRNGCAP